MRVGHYHGSQAIEAEGHRFGLALEFGSRRGRSDLDPHLGQFSCFISCRRLQKLYMDACMDVFSRKVDGLEALKR